MSKIKSIYIKNIKAIEEFELPLNGATVLLTGGNNKGKSTILKSIVDRLRGEKPDLVLRDESKNGIGELELTDGNKFIWKTLTDGTEEVLFVSKDGKEYRASKDIRNEYFPKVFDIDDFLSATPKEKVKTIREITGVDLELIEAMYKEHYDMRTILGRAKDAESAKRVPIDFSLPESPLSSQEITDKLSEVKAHNKQVEMTEDRKRDKMNRVNLINEEIERLIKEKNDLSMDIAIDTQWLIDNPRRDADTPLVEKMNEINELNEKILLNNEAKRQEKLYADALAEWEEMDRKVKDLDRQRAEELSRANLPKGFSIKNMELHYNDLPLDKNQQSSSALYIAGLKLAKELLGEVKTLHFDASFLDKNSLNEIWKWAKDNDLQLLIERPDYDGGEITYKFLQNENKQQD